MPITPEEVKAFIDEIARQQENFPQSRKGEVCWFDDLSEEVKTQVGQMGFPPEIVAQGRELLERYARRIGYL